MGGAGVRPNGGEKDKILPLNKTRYHLTQSDNQSFVRGHGQWPGAFKLSAVKSQIETFQTF